MLNGSHKLTTSICDSNSLWLLMNNSNIILWMKLSLESLHWNPLFSPLAGCHKHSLLGWNIISYQLLFILVLVSSFQFLQSTQLNWVSLCLSYTKFIKQEPLWSSWIFVNIFLQFLKRVVGGLVVRQPCYKTVVMNIWIIFDYNASVITVYHVIAVYYAVHGKRGFRFYNLPLFNWRLSLIFIFLSIR